MFLHISGYEWENPISFASWQKQNIFDGISRWGVPVFVMISGSVFLNRSVPIETFLRKYLPRIITAFLVWSIIDASVLAVQNHNHSITHIVREVAAGHYHMWFLYMVVGLRLFQSLCKLKILM